MSITAACPKCDGLVFLETCANCGHRYFSWGRFASGREGWFCVRCRLGDKFVTCGNCKCTIASVLFKADERFYTHALSR